MKVWTLDFESFWDTDYTLSKMTTDSYVLDPRFEVQGLAVRPPSGGYLYFLPKDVPAVLRAIPWSEVAVACHNTAFDGFIMRHHHRTPEPKLWIDTMSMARVCLPGSERVSLANCAKFFGLEPKGDETVRTRGRRFNTFTQAERQALADYAKHDAKLTWQILQIMLGHEQPPEQPRRSYHLFPKSELIKVDRTLRMFLEPKLYLNQDKLEKFLLETQDRKAALLKQCGLETRDDLMSNEKFAALLEAFDVEVPTKISPTTGKVTLALSKRDPDFKALLDHEDQRVVDLVEARLDVKSTGDQTRTERLLLVSRAKRPWPVLLNYGGAKQTNRWSGGNRQNPQNLRRGGALRDAIEAPPGHVIVVADSSQIEPRTLSCFAGQTNLTDAFRNKRDTYAEMATAVYGFPVNKKDNPLERQVGKTCLAGDTRVLTTRGAVPLTEVQLQDQLWDGQQWVSHNGLVLQGTKEVVAWNGLAATLDHNVLVDHKWMEWREVHTSPSLFQKALSSANLPPVLGSATSRQGAGVAGGTQYANAPAGGRAWYCEKTCSPGDQPDATNVQRSLPPQSGTGSTRTPCRRTSIEPGYSTDCRLRSVGATAQTTEHLQGTAGEASRCGPSGELIARRFCGTCANSPAGTTPLCSLTAETTTRDTCQGTCGSSRPRSTGATSGQSATCRSESGPLKRRLPVYDLANAGPNHRFTVLTDAGPIIVHNCILGLGYGMGPPKFQLALKTDPIMPIDLPIEQCENAVSIYRTRMYTRIPELWRTAEHCLRLMSEGVEQDFGWFRTIRNGLVLPNGFVIRYDGLEFTEYKGKRGWFYYKRGKPTSIYGAKVVENVNQALAGIVVGDQLVEASRREVREVFKHQWVLMSHDEGVFVCPEEHGEGLLKYVLEVMHRPPTWSPVQIPVAAEGGIGRTYSEAK